MREAQPLGRPMQPITICAYEVDAEPVVAALDESVCAGLGVSRAELSCPTWEAEMLAGKVPASQALSDRLIGQGYAGMLVESFAAGTDATDVNLVLWRWGAEVPCRVTLLDDENRLSARKAPPMTD